MRLFRAIFGTFFYTGTTVFHIKTCHNTSHHARHAFNSPL
ncbi:hypothetical protein H3L98_02240 [Conchiformibius steedae]|nr:hypothetical protein H3L98_02240 [Conchiformibius steedae]